MTYIIAGWAVFVAALLYANYKAEKLNSRHDKIFNERSGEEK